MIVPALMKQCDLCFEDLSNEQASCKLWHDIANEQAGPQDLSLGDLHQRYTICTQKGHTEWKLRCLSMLFVLCNFKDERDKGTISIHFIIQVYND